MKILLSYIILMKQKLIILLTLLMTLGVNIYIVNAEEYQIIPYGPHINGTHTIILPSSLTMDIYVKDKIDIEELKRLKESVEKKNHTPFAYFENFIKCIILPSLPYMLAISLID